MDQVKAPGLRGTVYSDQLGQVYVKRMTQLVTSMYPEVSFVPWPTPRWAILRRQRPAAIQVQWFDVILRRKSTFRAYAGAVRLAGFLFIARLFGIGTLVIFHNPAGKGHKRLALDRALRTALVAIGRSFVVLNPGAIDGIAAEISKELRPRFKRLVHLVPHPTRILDHGPRISKEAARMRLSISAEQPLAIAIPGANQTSDHQALEDEEGRYALLLLSRSTGPMRVTPTPYGYLVTGRPTDEEFGLLVSAADAVILTDPNAFGSATLHTAVDLGRPIIAPRCPATQELGDLGGAHLTEGVPTPVAIAEALPALGSRDLEASFREFLMRHNDERVAQESGAAFAKVLPPV